MINKGSGIMFENSKTDTEKRISSLSEEILDIKNQKKLAELDFEKRVLLLEDSVNTINKTVGSAKNLKDMKENLDHILDVQSKIREVEDREIIDRLESMQAKDTLNLLEDNVETISKKLELLSNAVKTLGEKANDGNKNTKESIVQKIGAGSKDIDLLRSEIMAVRTGMADAKSVEAIELKFNVLKKSLEDLDKNFADLASSARGSFKKRDTELAVIQKKIEELETIQVKTSIISSQVDSLRDADKKMESIVSSLRNQICLAEQKVKPLEAAQELGKKAFNETGLVKKEFAEAKKGFEESLKKQGNEFRNSLGTANDSIKKEKSEIQKAYSSTQKEYSKIKEGLEDLNRTLEKRVTKSTMNALEKQTRLQKESLAALRNATKRVEKKGNEIDNALTETHSKYSKVCSMLKGRDVQEVVSHLKHLKETEEQIKNDVSAGLSAKTKKIVDEELKDVTDNLRKISEFARNTSIKQEDVEHIVENKITSLTADYNKFGKALGTLQRIVQQEHANINQDVHNKVDGEMARVKDEIEDLREDIELLKSLRGDLVEDINRIIAGYEDKNKTKTVEKLEHTAEYEAERMDRLDEAFNKKLAELMKRMETEHKCEQGVSGQIESKISVIERENQSLREELEELKGAYFQIMKLQQNAPIIIE